MENLDLVGTTGVTDYTVLELDCLNDELDSVPEWVDFSSDYFCRIESFDSTNNAFIFAVSNLSDEFSCQVVYDTDSESFDLIYIIPTVNEFNFLY